MEVGVEVLAQNPVTGEERHTNSCFVTFVALDDEGRPIPVPPLLVETEEEQAPLRRRPAPPRGAAGQAGEITPPIGAFAPLRNLHCPERYTAVTEKRCRTQGAGCWLGTGRLYCAPFAGP